MFVDDEIQPGCEVWFRPTPEQVEHLSEVAVLPGHLRGIVKRKVLGVPRWWVTVGTREVLITKDVITVLADVKAAGSRTRR